MKVLLTGGGTGGHITPLLAVAQALKRSHANIQIVYIGEKNSQFADLTKDTKLFDEQYFIHAGKFRRYHGESFIRRIFDFKTIFLNLADIVRIKLGFWESYRLLGKIKPDVILLKGGYVGMPVGLAAALRRMPFVTHDSDALPGLANRMVSRWAVRHATGMPAEFYAYPSEKTTYVGVLVGDQYHMVTNELKAQYRDELAIPQDSKLITVTGGSLGAQRLNTAMREIVPALFEQYPKLHIIHQVGRGNLGVYEGYQHRNLQVKEFLEGLYLYTGAADVVVTRAGANTLAELGVQQKACIVVPNPLLTGGHQLKNAEVLDKAGAVKVVTEEQLNQNGAVALLETLRELLDNTELQSELGTKMHQITISDAADKLADLLVDVAEQGEK